MLTNTVSQNKKEIFKISQNHLKVKLVECQMLTKNAYKVKIIYNKITLL